jgi:hypothetical protein
MAVACHSNYSSRRPSIVREARSALHGENTRLSFPEGYLARWIATRFFEEYTYSITRGDFMELSNWPTHELQALAGVFIRHKRFNKAGELRAELSRRISEGVTDESGEAGNEELSVFSNLLEQLDESNVITFKQRVTTYASKVVNLISLSRISA